MEIETDIKTLEAEIIKNTTDVVFRENRIYV